MEYTLQELRDYVRLHVDLDADELPNSMLDTWANDASIKISRSRKRWPFFEESWVLVTTPGQNDYPLATSFDPIPDEITSIVRDDRRLSYLGRDEAEGSYLPYQNNAGYVSYFNVWKDTLRLYPTPDSADTLYVRGYRKVTDWVSDGPGALPDFPREFHDAIRMYMLAQAYLQQEDPEMFQQFLGSFEAEMRLLSKQYGDAPGPYPLVLGGGPMVRRPGRLTFPFE